MSESRKYFYIKLKDNYFDRDNVKILESVENGYIYSLIILKLYLKSCRGSGKLMMTDSIPYDSDKIEVLAKVINHDVAHVKEAIKLGIELDLITVTHAREIWMNEMQNMIGSSSSEADRVRKYRKNIEGTDFVQNSYKCTPELDLEIDIEKEIEKDYDEEIPFPGSISIQPEEEDFSLPLFKKLCFEFMKIYNHRNGQVMSPTGRNFTRAADIFRCENPEQLYNQAILVIDYFFNTPFWFNTEKKEPGKIKKHLCTLGVFLSHLPAIISDYNEKQEAKKQKTESENSGNDYAKMMDERRKQIEEERATEADEGQISSSSDPGG